MKTRLLSAFLVLVVFGLAAGVWYLASTSSGRDLFETGLDMDVPRDLDWDVLLENIELSHGEQGRLVWKLQAREAGYTYEEELTDIEDPVATYYGRDGLVLEVTAPKGRLLQAKQRAVMWPRVVVTQDEMEITGDRMNYLGGEQELQLDGNVSMQGKGMSLTAPRLRVDLESGTLLATDGVRADVLMSGRLGVLPIGGGS
jgi:LPS export ABC transporter protein LptC